MADEERDARQMLKDTYAIAAALKLDPEVIIKRAVELGEEHASWSTAAVTLAALAEAVRP